MRNLKSPYATAVLVLGISSIALCCCYGIPGILTGVIALILYNKEKVIYNQDKANYRSFESLKTGRTLSIIGITMSSLYILYLLFALSQMGSEVFSDPTLLLKRFE
jgi:hypothetical protein